MKTKHVFWHYRSLPQGFKTNQKLPQYLIWRESYPHLHTAAIEILSCRPNSVHSLASRYRLHNFRDIGPYSCSHGSVLRHSSEWTAYTTFRPSLGDTGHTHLLRYSPGRARTPWGTVLYSWDQSTRSRTGCSRRSSVHKMSNSRDTCLYRFVRKTRPCTGSMQAYLWSLYRTHSLGDLDYTLLTYSVY